MSIILDDFTLKDIYVSGPTKEMDIQDLKGPYRRYYFNVNVIESINNNILLNDIQTQVNSLLSELIRYKGIISN